MIKRLEEMEKRYNEVSALMADMSVIADTTRWTTLAKEHSELEEPVLKYLEYKKKEREMNDAFSESEKETDKEMRQMLIDEGYDCKEKLAKINEELKILLLPKDKNDDRNVMVEIRAGAGGEEACLFAYQLMRMYVKYAENNRFKVEEIETSSTELGGIKEVVFAISGKGVYSQLKYESGVHRVQRVPDTESQGRVHTSTATVAVLPEPEDIDVKIEEKDLKIDTYRSSGAGGQHVNKTESCIRMTHLPTGIVVTCQDERSQIKNREKAMKVLKSRIYDYYNTKYEAEYAQNRKSQVGTGDRSERIRTYNFPQSRVTDHRIGMTIYTIDTFIMGDIQPMIDALAIADREAKLSGEDELS